mmetsp:Transcript_4381/g.9563  ORF Transcript_4381/g.9563 Transcript_4381/m.9563 type:complete len:598 (-) Transcript_4381:299-2092(-)
MPSSQQHQAPLSCMIKTRCSEWFVVATIILFISFENGISFASATDSDTSNERSGSNGKVCSTSLDDPTCTSSSSSQSILSLDLGRPLRPTDLPQPVPFTAFKSNFTITLSSGIEQDVATGVVKQINNFDNPTRDDVRAHFAVLSSAVKRSSIEQMLELLQSYNDWDDDPDTVDGMTSHEMFVDSPELYQSKESIKFRDVNPEFVPARKELRRKLTEIMSPYLDQVITPMVHARYPDACTDKGPGRTCTPCYSLIRKYKHGQRQSHAMHHDAHALVTVVVSLSDYDINYRGGLYVSTGFGQREFMALNKGDAVMHQASLLHGVQVYDVKDNPTETERWSWILWYKDSSTCEDDYGYEWFRECAGEGDALCQHFHATKVGATPGISNDEASRRVLELNMEAADGGSGISAVKIARAYLGQLPSALPYDVRRAMEYYMKAVMVGNPDGHYGMSQMLLKGVESEYTAQSSMMQLKAWQDELVKQAVDHLEIAAYAGHAFSMFNLGIAHTFGYVNGSIDSDLAGQWFEASGLPEGYFVAANQAAATRNTAREKEMMKRAKEMGYFTPWRAEARQRTGSGGAGGVDLNLPWPPSFDQRRPPNF